MKRRLTLPSSALLGSGKLEPEEDPKKRREKVRKEELDIEEGLASISSNHSTGSVPTIKTWIHAYLRGYGCPGILKRLHREKKEES
jgi:hypothetical protein